MVIKSLTRAMSAASQTSATIHRPMLFYVKPTAEFDQILAWIDLKEVARLRLARRVVPKVLLQV